MAKQRRLKKMAKNIAAQPKHKKMMAEFLADYLYGNYGKEEIKKMLINGHRGYLAMDETKLGKLFDQTYDSCCNELQSAENETEDLSGWGINRREKRIETAKEVVRAAEEVYDEIFEAEFL